MNAFILDDKENLSEAVKLFINSIDKLDSSLKLNTVALEAVLKNLDKPSNSESKKETEKKELAKFIGPLTEEETILSELTAKKEARKSEENLQKLESDNKDYIIKNPNKINDSLKGAGYKLEREFGTVFTNITTLTTAAAILMRDSMSTFFFDAMTGKVKSFEEYFQNFVNGIKKAVSQLLSNLIMKGVTDLIMPKASGGRVAAGTPFIAGESGPELISVDGAGATVISANTTSSMLAGANSLAVEVNVINQSGTQMQASQGETRFDGQKYVIDVFLDAWARDVSGLRTAVAGRG